MNRTSFSDTNKQIGKTASAGFQVGVRRTFPIPQEQAWEMLTSPEGLTLWLGNSPSVQLEVGHSYQSDDGISGQFRVVKLYQQLRLTWQKKGWERPSTLQIRFLSSKPDKTTISFHQENLADSPIREQMKLHWEGVLLTLQKKIIDA